MKPIFAFLAILMGVILLLTIAVAMASWVVPVTAGLGLIFAGIASSDYWPPTRVG